MSVNIVITHLPTIFINFKFKLKCSLTLLPDTMVCILLSIGKGHNEVRRSTHRGIC